MHVITAERIARHGFVDRADRNVVSAARRTTAVQAQDPQASRFGLRSRSSTITERDVLAAIEERDVVRTWLMRATIHLVAADDVRWLTALIGPSLSRRFRKRWLDLGLTPEVLRRTADTLPDVLSGRPPRTKAEIVRDLADRGVTFPDDDPQASIHVLLHATSEGLLCRGPERGHESTFTLLDEWLPPAPSAASGPRGDEALAELARRYFTAFSPATAADFTTWSGLPSSQAIRLIADELEPVAVDGRRGYRHLDLPDRAVTDQTLRFLAGFDNYLVGYRDRSLFVPAGARSDVYVGGIIRPVVLVDGVVTATWRVARTAEEVVVSVTPVSRQDVRGTTLPAAIDATLPALDAEVVDIGRFTGLTPRLELRPR